MYCNTQRSSSGRPRLHIRSRLGQQPHTDLPSRWNISSGVRMLGIRGWGIQGTGRDRCHVQWQHSSLRQREPPHSSFLTAPATNRFVISLTKPFSSKNLKFINYIKIVNYKYYLYLSIILLFEVFLFYSPYVSL